MLGYKTFVVERSTGCRCEGTVSADATRASLVAAMMFSRSFRGWVYDPKATVRAEGRTAKPALHMAASKGEFAVVRHLVEEVAADPMAEDGLVFVKTKAGVHDVEVAGTETVENLYKKAGCAAGLMVRMFKLVWEEKVLSRFGDGEVQNCGLVEGAVVNVVPGTVVGLTELKESPEVKLELERLVAADPELVLEVDVGDSTPDKMVCIEEDDLPSGLQGLVVTDSTNCAWDIGDDFLCNSPSTLKSLDLNLKLNTIGSGFLRESSILSINFGDASLYSNVITIGDEFMSEYNEQWTTLDLSVFSNVTSIGDHFMANSPGLEDVNLRGFTNVTSIGDCFLSECSCLQSVVLSDFTNVTTIGSDFLANCWYLQNVDLSGFTNVTTIDSCFLYSCSDLKKVDLSGLTNVTKIGCSFLALCGGLQNLDLSGFTNLTSIDAEFLSGCYELQNLDLRSFTNVTKIGSQFLVGCSGLQNLDLSCFTNVTTIRSSFLYKCTNLRSLDLSCFTNVTSIGNGFLARCTGLQNMDLSAFTNLTSIGNKFMYRCRSLQNLDLRSFTNVATIKSGFLSHCKGLKNIEASPDNHALTVALCGVKL